MTRKNNFVKIVIQRGVIVWCLPFLNVFLKINYFLVFRNFLLQMNWFEHCYILRNFYLPITRKNNFVKILIRREITSIFLQCLPFPQCLPFGIYNWTLAYICLYFYCKNVFQIFLPYILQVTNISHCANYLQYRAIYGINFITSKRINISIDTFLDTFLEILLQWKYVEHKEILNFQKIYLLPKQL